MSKQLLTDNDYVDYFLQMYHVCGTRSRQYEYLCDYNDRCLWNTSMYFKDYKNNIKNNMIHMNTYVKK